MNTQTNTPYIALCQLVEELHKLAMAGNWDASAILAQQINASVQADKLGLATLADRQAIEQSLHYLNACLYKAEPTRDDVARLLKGFGIDTA